MPTGSRARAAAEGRRTRASRASSAPHTPIWRHERVPSCQAGSGLHAGMLGLRWIKREARQNGGQVGVMDMTP